MKVIRGDVFVTLDNKPIKQNSIICYSKSMSNIHQLTVRNKSENPEKIATGFNTEVLIDGQPLKGVKSFSFEVTAQSVGLVKIELYAHVEINTYADLNIVEQKNPISKAEANRLLAGYFLELTPQKRENVANQLGLLPDKHYDVPRIELAKMIFQKARETNKLAQLWDEVLETHPNKSEILNKLNLFTNPFNNEISESCILENQTPKTQ